MVGMQYEMSKYGVSWFKFDEESGNITDSKGAAVGTIHGGVTRVTGWNGEGKSLNFNGTNGYVEFNEQVIPSGKKSIRFKMKVGTSLLHGAEILLSNHDTKTNTGFQLWLRNTGTIVFFDRAGSLNVLGEKTVDIFDNEWHDILYTWDGTTNVNGIKLYIDDLLNPIGMFTANALPSADYVGRLMLGKNTNGNNEFSGQMDDLEIYNGVIEAIHNKVLVKSGGTYKYYKDDVWNDIGSSVTELDHLYYGMNPEELPSITPKSWQELSNPVISYYTDDLDKEEIIIETETEPFTLKDEMGDSMKVLCYVTN